MTEQEIPRSIRFPKALWEAIDEDAKRCRRSSVKQLEAILTVYYDLENVEIDRSRLKGDESQKQKGGEVRPDLVDPRVPVRNIKLRSEKGDVRKAK